MSDKKLVYIFIIVAAIQLCVPIKMILNREDIINNGNKYKFKTEPIDPNDPFRGKFITLHYEDDKIDVTQEEDWIRGENIFVYLTSDKDGFAKILSVSKTKQNSEYDFFKAKVKYISNDGSNSLTIDYPFDRYYMEESKAYEAELTYRKLQLDSSKNSYALVRIKNGEAVLTDVLIDAVSLREIVIKELQKKGIECK